MYTALMKLALNTIRGKKPSIEALHSVLLDARQKRLQGEQPALPPLSGRLLKRDENSLRKLQLKKLRATLRHAYTTIPYYHAIMKQNNLQPEDFKELSDLRKLPITRKEDIQKDPYKFLCTSKDCQPIVGEITTSGTTGKPLPVYFTWFEIEYRTTLSAIAALLTGNMEPSDIVQSHMGAGRGAGTAWISEIIARKAGAMVLRYGFRGDLDEHVHSIFENRRIPGKKSKVSVLQALPSYMLRLTERVEELGLRFQDAGLKSLATGSDFISDYFKERMRQTWGKEVYEGYGLVETTPCTSIECREHRYLHFPSMFGLPEVVDPETFEPLQPGEKGVFLITTFYPERELMPFLRFWTGDVVTMADETQCPCGITSDQIEDIMGRIDYRVKIGGTGIFPEQIVAILSKYQALPIPARFNVACREVASGHEVILNVESRHQLIESERRGLADLIKAEIENISAQFQSGAIRCIVSIHPPGALQTVFPVKTLA